MNAFDSTDSLSKRLTRSSLWMLLNTGAVRLTTFATQIALTAILAKSDFGVYALAVSISALATNFRGGGMLQWMQQGGREHLKERSAPTFWISLVFNIILGLLIVALAIPAADFFGQPQVAEIMTFSGASFPLLTLSSYYRTLLSIDIRMRDVTTIEVVSGIARGVLTIAFALAGFGALSFVLPLPLTYMLEGAMGYAYSRAHPWRSNGHLKRAHLLIWRNRWILAGTFVITVSLQADYAILGRMTTIETVGVYYFAFQMTYMSAALVTENARRVLTPGLVALPIERRASAALRASSTFLILGAPLLLLFACAIAPLENIVWHDKWDEAVQPIQIFSIGLPLQLLTTITQSSLQSDGRFRVWTAVNLLRALAVIAGALAAGFLVPGNIGAIAAIMALSFAVANLAQIHIAFQAQGIGVRQLLRWTSSGLLLAPTALGVSLILDQVTSWPDGISLLANCAAFTLIYAALVATFARPQLLATTRLIRSSLGK